MTTTETVLSPEQIDEMDAGSIVVGERTRDVHAYNTDGGVMTLGQVVTRNYRGESAQRHAFRSVENGKLYKLGVTTNNFKFIDHTSALDPLVNRGYKLKDTVYSRGGIHMYAVLERPDAAEINDPIDWDIQYWHDVHGEGLKRVPRQLKESVVVYSSVKPGKGMRYNRGWFRMVCSNGLIAEILRLGATKLNHINWAATTVVDKLRLTDRIESLDMGPVAGSRRGAQKFADLLDSFVGLPDEAEQDPEDGTVSASVAEALDDLPFFVRDEMSSLLQMPTWFRQSLAGQTRAMADGKAKNGKIFALEVINAVTNPINLERFGTTESPRSVLRPLMRATSLTSATMKMIGAYSL